MPKDTKFQAKLRKWDDLQKACCDYSKCLFVEVDDVTSEQFSIIKRAITELGGKMVMGKNTFMKACIAELMTKPKKGDINYDRMKERYAERPHLKIVSDQLRLNIGMIWTNGDLYKIKDILDANYREAPARIGSIAPKDAIIPAGSTGLDPQQTRIFQDLSIRTKISYAQIEIVNPVTIIKKGEKINKF